MRIPRLELDLILVLSLLAMSLGCCIAVLSAGCDHTPDIAVNAVVDPPGFCGCDQDGCWVNDWNKCLLLEWER